MSMYQPLFQFYASYAGCGLGSVAEQMTCLRNASISALARAQDERSFVINKTFYTLLNAAFRMPQFWVVQLIPCTPSWMVCFSRGTQQDCSSVGSSPTFRSLLGMLVFVANLPLCNAPCTGRLPTKPFSHAETTISLALKAYFTSLADAEIQEFVRLYSVNKFASQSQHFHWVAR